MASPRNLRIRGAVPGRERTKNHVGYSSTPSKGTSNPASQFEVVKKFAKDPANGLDSEKEDLFQGRYDGVVPELSIEYTVTPGSTWRSMRSYQNLIVSDEKIGVGSIIYTNRYDDLEMPAGLSSADQLEFDRKYLWVGQILECRAESEREVNVLVHWFCWTEALPMGRQPYHGERELVLTDFMDVIDSQSIASPAEMSHWNENDNPEGNNLEERFWRQKLYICKPTGARKETLSELRKYCTCAREYNPDGRMVKCMAEDCGFWSHEECLVANVCSRAYDLSSSASRSQPSKTRCNSGRVKSTNGKRQPMEAHLTKAKRDVVNTTDGEKRGVPGRAGPTFPWVIPPEDSRPWSGKFTAKLSGKGKVVAYVERQARKLNRGQDLLDVCCLHCGALLRWERQ